MRQECGSVRSVKRRARENSAWNNVKGNVVLTAVIKLEDYRMNTQSSSSLRKLKYKALWMSPFSIS